MLNIETITEARLTSVTNRIEKHGDEDVPAVTLAVEITTANTLLDQIDPAIRLALYKAVEGQEELPGVEPATPVLRCNCFDSVSLTTAHEGWRLLVDDGLDETTPMEFEGVKVDKLKVDAKQGGSVVLKLRLGTSDIDADRLGKLGMHNGQSIWIKLLKPEKAPDVIDGSVEAFKADHPDATDLFAAGGESNGANSESETQFGASEDGESESEGPTSGFAAADDGAAEQAAIEAGMAESVKAAGLKPKRRGRAAGVGEVH